MSMPKLHNPRTRRESPDAGEPIWNSPAAQKWGVDCAKSIEANFARYEQELFAGASESDYRKRMLASALLALLDEGLSRDELVDVLGSTDIFPSFISPISPLHLSGIKEDFFARVDGAILTELDQLATGFFETQNASRAPDGALLYLGGQTVSEPAHGSLHYRSRTTAATSVRLDHDAGLAAIALSDRTAISWNPACDARLRPHALEWMSAHDIRGSMMAIRLDDLVGESLAVLVVYFGSVLKLTDRATEESLLDELQKRCVALRSLLICRRLVQRLVDEFVGERRGQERSCATLDAPQAGGLADQIDLLYEQLARFNSERLERPWDGTLQNRIHECFASLRRLQEEEVVAIERHVSRSISLPLGESANLFHRANELVNKYANPPRADNTSD